MKRYPLAINEWSVSASTGDLKGSIIIRQILILPFRTDWRKILQYIFEAFICATFISKIQVHIHRVWEILRSPQKRNSTPFHSLGFGISKNSFLVRAYPMEGIYFPNFLFPGAGVCWKHILSLFTRLGVIFRHILSWCPPVPCEEYSSQISCS